MRLKYIARMKLGLRLVQRKLVLFSLAAFLVSFPTGKVYAEMFDFNTRCQQAYLEISQLKLKNGQILIDE